MKTFINVTKYKERKASDNSDDCHYLYKESELTRN